MAIDQDMRYVKFKDLKIVIKNVCANFARKLHTHSKNDITDFPSSLPASDVSTWAKAKNKPQYTKAEIGLGNVDNTADANKSVKYADTSGNSATVNGHTVNANVPENAKFTDTIYNDSKIKEDLSALSNDFNALGLYVDADGDICQKEV